jgi:SAM-dependent methyltransferase
VAAVICLYVIIHLDDQDREAAYGELARVLRPGGHALIAFHVRDADHDAGDGLVQR